MSDFNITVGDASSFEVEIKDCDQPINTNEYLIFFTIKKPFYGAVNLAPEDDEMSVIKKNNKEGGGITNLPDGKIRITILSSESQYILDGDYVYDVQVARISATDEVFTVVSGTITFDKQITSRKQIG
jgi:hypothetical protein